jgi:hypothetical protein
VPERMGMAQVSTHHCSFPASLRDEVERFVEAFLLDQDGVDTNVLESDAVTADLARWAPWRGAERASRPSCFNRLRPSSWQSTLAPR